MGVSEDLVWKEILDGKTRWSVPERTPEQCDLFDAEVVRPLRELEAEGRIRIKEIKAPVPGKLRVVQVLLLEILNMPRRETIRNGQMLPAQNRKATVIRILEIAANEGLPEQIGPEETLDRIAICAELVDAGYLTGSVVKGQQGCPVNVCGARITAWGHEYLEELKNKRKEGRPLSIAKRRAVFLLRWVFLPFGLTVAGAVAVALILKWLALK